MYNSIQEYISQGNDPNLVGSCGKTLWDLCFQLTRHFLFDDESRDIKGAMKFLVDNGAIPKIPVKYSPTLSFIKNIIDQRTGDAESACREVRARLDQELDFNIIDREKGDTIGSLLGEIKSSLISVGKNAQSEDVRNIEETIELYQRAIKRIHPIVEKAGATAAAASAPGGPVIYAEDDDLPPPYSSDDEDESANAAELADAPHVDAMAAIGHAESAVDIPWK